MKFNSVEEFGKFINDNLNEHIIPYAAEEFQKIVPEIDSENFNTEDLAWSDMDIGEKKYYGAHEVDGFYIFGFNMGGDWQNPMFGILFQAKDELLYFYCPKSGNPVEIKNGVPVPYGADCGTDDKYKINHDLIIEDIKAYLQTV